MEGMLQHYWGWGMSDLRDTLYKQYVQDTDPRYPSGREGWETYLVDRIAELTTELSQVAAYLETMTDRCAEETQRNAELGAENAALRKQIEKWKLARWRDAGCPIGGGE